VICLTGHFSGESEFNYFKRREAEGVGRQAKTKNNISIIQKMRIYSFNLLLIFSIILITNSGCNHKPEYTQEVQDRINRVENNLAGWVQVRREPRWSLAERMAFYNIKGLSIAVVHDYKIEWAKGYGWADISENRLVTEKTLFQAASISKSLNGIGVLTLVQDKKLDLNTDINDYLKSWKFPYDEKSNNRKITIANLLSHTAGLNIHGFPGYSVNDSIPTLQQVLDGKRPANTEPVRSLLEPGIKVEYSGGGVTIAQQIIEDVTEQPYAVFMQKNVLDPLGMSSSFFTQPPDRKHDKVLATGYYLNGEEVKGKYHVYPEQAAAGLWTNPIDLCTYIIETQLSYQGKSGKVLSPEITKLRLTPVMQDAALGVFVTEKGTAKYFMHNGGNEGFTCQAIGSLDDGNGVVIMTNSDNASILDEIVNSVAITYRWKDYYQPVIKNIIKVPEATLDTYIGKYEISGGAIVTIKKDDTGLRFLVNGNTDWRIFFTSDTDFFVKEYRGEMKFVSDPSGKINGFKIYGNLAKKTD
jgi:CubicO group peptidase (beta-lactamase class C family)